MANATWTAAEGKLMDEEENNLKKNYPVDDRIMLTRVAEDLGANLVNILDEYRHRSGRAFRKHALEQDKIESQGQHNSKMNAEQLQNAEQCAVSLNEGSTDEY
jgi:ABC-type enterochelin transport system ATPase subunit